MERRDAVKAMGVLLTSAVIAPYIEMVPVGVIFPDPVNPIISIEMVGLYGATILREFDALFLFGDVVQSDEFQGWMEIINT